MTLHASQYNLSEYNDIYALIDSIQHPDAAGYAAELSRAGLAGALVAPGGSDFVTEDTVPYALSVTPRVARFVEGELWRTGEDAAEPAWGLFAEPRAGGRFADALAHWRAWYFVEVPVKDAPTPAWERVVFRFWDARLVGAFLDACTLPERAAFFGPLARLMLPRADGGVTVVEAPEEAAAVPSAPFPMRPEHLAALEVRRLELRTPAFRAYLDAHFEDRYAPRGIEDRDAFVHAGIRAAADRGFLSERGAVTWLSLHLLHGADFAEERPWARVILEDPNAVAAGRDRLDRLADAGFAEAEEKGAA